MTLRREHTRDPITGKDLSDHRDLPYIVEQTDEGEMTVYFESAETRLQYLNTPPGEPARDFTRARDRGGEER